jgi:hypothetical protein
LRTLDHAVAEAVEGETDPRAYTECGRLLADIFGRAILSQDFERAAGLVGMLRRHSLDPMAGFAKRHQEAQNILANLAHAEALGTVMEKFLSEQKDHYAVTRDILVKLGAAVVPVLLAEVRRAKDRTARFVLADVIKTIGADAVALYDKEVQGEGALPSLKRLLDIAPNVGREAEVFEMLKSLLQSHDAAVRLEALRVLPRMTGAKGSELVCVGLQDTNPHVLAEAIGFAGQIPCKASADLLLEIVRGGRGPGQAEGGSLPEAACRVLAVMGDERIVPDLIEIARRRRMLDQFRKSYPVSLRCEAARALARFKENPEVSKLLQSLLSDDDPDVKKAAQWALSEGK